jgi:hypothetical protein
MFCDLSHFYLQGMMSYGAGTYSIVILAVLLPKWPYCRIQALAWPTYIILFSIVYFSLAQSILL